MPDNENDLKLWERLLIKTVPPLLAALIDTWCRSCRVVERINEEAERNAIYACNGAVYATWHQRMFYFFRDYGNKHIVMMISKSKDGDYANEVALSLGFLSVRGSRLSEGRKAMHQLIHMLKQGGFTAGMMADGPIGPPRVLKMGAVKIARETGKPVIPMMYGARRKIILKSWDRYILPVPFTDIVVYHGSPVFVPHDASEEECERIRREVECTMNRMADACDAYWGGLPVGKPGFDLPEPEKVSSEPIAGNVRSGTTSSRGTSEDNDVIPQVLS